MLHSRETVPVPVPVPVVSHSDVAPSCLFLEHYKPHLLFASQLSLTLHCTRATDGLHLKFTVPERHWKVVGRGSITALNSCLQQRKLPVLNTSLCQIMSELAHWSALFKFWKYGVPLRKWVQSLVSAVRRGTEREWKAEVRGEVGLVIV